MQFLKKLSIQKKVVLGYFLSFIILAASIFVTIKYVNRLDHLSNELVTHDIPMAQNTLHVMNDINMSIAALRGWVILGSEEFKTQREISWKQIKKHFKIISSDPEFNKNPNNQLLSKYLKEYESLQTRIQNISYKEENTPATKIFTKKLLPLFKKIISNLNANILLSKNSNNKDKQKIILDITNKKMSITLAISKLGEFLNTGDKKLQEDFKTEINKNKMTDGVSDFITIADELFTIRNGNRWNIANHLFATKADPIAKIINNTLKVEFERQSKRMNKDGERSNQMVHDLIKVEALILLLGAVMIVLLTFFVSNSIKQAIDGITKGMAKGMSTITELAQKVNDSSQSLSVSNEQQSSSIHETSATMNEIEAMVKKNMGSSQDSKEVATQSFDMVTVGAKRIQEMVTSVTEIEKSNNQVADRVVLSNKKMSEVTEIIKGISAKTEIINDIVFQTKLLSFNASVEAARAGENGKGFAVVAEEIGNLASMSGQASVEINVMLEESIQTVTSVALEQQQDMDILIDQNRDNIKRGKSIGVESEDILNKILQNMNLLQESVSQITLASEEQSNGVTEITKAINEISEGTRMNTEVSQEASYISKHLTLSVEDVNLLITELQSNKQKAA